ncbi:MAG: winged helix-turn-helix domain-containing protein [Actinomycetota bacterium]|nr:winged helix-turn-helix domain-containing protein [Actinomycetota bacterium]
MSDVGDIPDDATDADGPLVRLDYELDDQLAADTPERMKAMGDPLRFAIADLVLERAMSVTELAGRLDRPKGTIAYHVDVLVDAGLLKVVRTRKVRAIEERFYGRTARTFVVHTAPGELPFTREASEAADVDREDRPHVYTLRRARIPAARAEEYVARLHALALEFSEEPRGGDTEYGLYVALFPTTRRIAPTEDPS